MQMILPVKFPSPPETHSQREIRMFREMAAEAERARRRAVFLAPFAAMLRIIKRKRARKPAPFNQLGECRPAYDPQI